MTFRFGLRSKTNLLGVHKDLQTVAHLALSLSTVDFTVTEGLRTAARQQELFNKGASKTLRSRHITGHAIDVAALVDGKIVWDWPEYEQIAIAFKEAARQLDIPITWGGDWESFRDGVHFELSHIYYPAPKDATAGVQA